MAHDEVKRTTLEEHSQEAKSPCPILAADKLAKIERRPRSSSKLQQPLEILGVPGALLRIGTVEVIVGLKRSAIYGHLKEGRFPAPVRNGARCSRWRSDDIRAYLASK